MRKYALDGTLLGTIGPAGAPAETGYAPERFGPPAGSSQGDRNESVDARFKGLIEIAKQQVQ